jgi:Na+/H+ antiporter NhaD/arsenite permease-like protein
MKIKPTFMKALLLKTKADVVRETEFAGKAFLNRNASLHRKIAKIGLAFFLCAAIFSLAGTLIANVSAFIQPAQASMQREGFFISGELVDGQNQPVSGAQITALLPGNEQPIAETESQEDGSWTLEVTQVPEEELLVRFRRPHFKMQTFIMHQNELNTLREEGIYRFGDYTLERRISAGFWIATLIFLGVLLAIAFEALHSTTAALAGFSLVFLFSYVGSAFDPDLFIFSFERGLGYINWEVIFLVMGMMIIVAVIEGTGIFQWMAFQAYRLSRGQSWLLVLILMLITAGASALLDNFTTMLLMTPISLQIGLALGINPLAFIIPEVLASNVGGITTLVGTPTNILIGAYAGIGFNDFLIHQTGGVLIALVAMGAYVLFHYRKEFAQGGGGISPTLYHKLEENAKLEDPDTLWKSGVVFVIVLVGFILGERVHMVPAVPAIAGATLLLIWLKPDVHSMIKAVDWTTLVFFMALFIVVGAIQEVGLLSFIAAGMSRVIGENLPLGIFMIVFGVGTVSTAIANIPLAASMLPIVKFLSGTIPGTGSNVLYYALSMGAAMGGNGLLIGGEANLVTAGITQQTSTPISFKEFLKVGLPVTYITLTIGFLWLLIHF